MNISKNLANSRMRNVLFTLIEIYLHSSYSIFVHSLVQLCNISNMKIDICGLRSPQLVVTGCQDILEVPKESTYGVGVPENSLAGDHNSLMSSEAVTI